MKILQIDAFELLKKLPDASIDHVITDPPYNISDKAKQTMVGPNIVPAMFGDWDCMDKKEYEKLFQTFLIELLRVVKDGANALIWLDRPFAGVAWFMAEEIGWKPRNIIAAIKRNPTRKLRQTNIKSAWESCLWLSKGPVKTLNWNPSKELERNVFFYNIGAEKVTDHPTEKYESMIEPLVEMYSNEGDVVFDPFCGSGTTAVVCKKKKRQFIGSDKNEKWIQTTKRRLDTTVDPIL